jgi:hypothetical protein
MYIANRFFFNASSTVIRFHAVLLLCVNICKVSEHNNRTYGTGKFSMRKTRCGHGMTRTGSPSRDRTDRIGQLGQDTPRQDSREKRARKEHPKHDSQPKLVGRMGQAEPDSQDKTARTGRPEKDSSDS